ncbi:MAG: hypothetical protein BWY74_03051 [Firmicutes bacterium ADurb.Bin419]|nr:MAG: hypothetical protein BWY74_03051 [Firmicutes bacterium ADurb.Bin419]
MNDNGIVDNVLATAYKEETIGPDQLLRNITKIRICDEEMKDVLPERIITIPEEINLEIIESITVHENNLYWKIGDEYFRYTFN